MTTPTPPGELVEQQRRAREREQYDTVILATVGVIPSSTTRVTFAIKPSLVAIGYGGARVVLTSVTVETWRAGVTPYADSDAEGSISVTGYGQRAKQNGEPDPRARYEKFRLTPELAAPLLLAAMTRSPVAPTPPTQEGDAS